MSMSLEIVNKIESQYDELQSLIAFSNAENERLSDLYDDTIVEFIKNNPEIPLEDHIYNRCLVVYKDRLYIADRESRISRFKTWQINPSMRDSIEYIGPAIALSLFGSLFGGLIFVNGLHLLTWPMNIALFVACSYFLGKYVRKQHIKEYEEKLKKLTKQEYDMVLYNIEHMNKRKINQIKETYNIK